MSDRTEPRQPPSALGFAKPAEWCRHEATWLAWPKDPVTWPDRVPQVQEIFLHMIALLGANERVELLVDDASTEEVVKVRLAGLAAGQGEVRYHHIRTADSWIRDYGPNFLRREADGQLALNDWIFNAWGGKYEELKRDSAIPEVLSSLLGVERFTPGIVLEGGAIDVNGEGICLTTEQCLLNGNRNPHLSREEIERYLCDYLGIKRVIWLGEGIVGDDTDGHIDDIARFVAPDTIVCSVEDDPVDPNFALLQDNLERLKKARDMNGNSFRILTLPMPGAVEGSEGRLPASYANFYIANELVLVPTFGHENDARALGILSELFPDRKVTGIHCEPLVWGLGTLHCVSQQQPASRQPRGNRLS